jgi:beta-phosphoglucomutase-like phosphatase (HAD superfamily)
MMQQIQKRLREAKCFLWDFDGCFADTERLHFLAYSKAFAHFGHTLNEVDYYPSFTHLGDGTRREIDSKKLSFPEQELMRLKNDAYGQMIRFEPVNCFKETLSIVQLMCDLGAKVAIASNSSEEDIRTVLGRAEFPIELLSAIVGKRPELKKKPAPDIFLHALRVLDCSPEQSVVLEDSNRGLQAAAAAGCLAVWIRTAYNRNLESTEPHIASLSHDQLLEVLGGSFAESVTQNSRTD